MACGDVIHPSLGTDNQTLISDSEAITHITNISGTACRHHLSSDGSHTVNDLN